MLSSIFSNTSVKKKKLLWPLILSFNPSGGLSQWLTDSWIDYKSKCLIWKAMYYYTTVIQVMNFPFFSICKWWKMILFFFLFSHLENTPSYQGKHIWLLFHLCVSRNGGSGSQAISAFVHRPKCVWCVEKQTKTSANGIRLTLDKYNSHRKCVYASLFKKKRGGGLSMRTWMPPSVGSVNHTKPGTHLDFISYRQLVVFMWLSLQLQSSRFTTSQCPTHYIPTRPVHLFKDCLNLHLQMPTAPLFWRWSEGTTCAGVWLARAHTHKKGGDRGKKLWGVNN